MIIFKILGNILDFIQNHFKEILFLAFTSFGSKKYKTFTNENIHLKISK